MLSRRSGVKDKSTKVTDRGCRGKERSKKNNKNTPQGPNLGKKRQGKRLWSRICAPRSGLRRRERLVRSFAGKQTLRPKKAPKTTDPRRLIQLQKEEKRPSFTSRVLKEARVTRLFRTSTTSKKEKIPVDERYRNIIGEEKKFERGKDYASVYQQTGLRLYSLEKLRRQATINACLHKKSHVIAVQTDASHSSLEWWAYRLVRFNQEGARKRTDPLPRGLRGKQSTTTKPNDTRRKNTKKTGERTGFLGRRFTPCCYTRPSPTIDCV